MLSHKIDKAQFELFVYWIKERHAIHLKRLAGEPKPWTSDKVMQQWFFTNPYRENDKTTVWFRQHVRNPLASSASVLMATVIARWFNYIPTIEMLLRHGAVTEPYTSHLEQGSLTGHTHKAETTPEGEGAILYTGTKVRPRSDQMIFAEMDWTQPQPGEYPSTLPEQDFPIIRRTRDPNPNIGQTVQYSMRTSTYTNGTYAGGYNLLTHWNEEAAYELLAKVRSLGLKVFTGAFMIKPGTSKDKIADVCMQITKIWKQRGQLLEQIQAHKSKDTLSLEWLCKKLMEFDGLGGFMSYEIVSDLRHTCILDKARDTDTWANLGPGGVRGLNRLLGRPFEASIAPDWQMQMLCLLLAVKEELSDLPPIEMREIEHSLCEFDKYMRAKGNEGKMKRTYSGLPGAPAKQDPNQMLLFDIDKACSEEVDLTDPEQMKQTRELLARAAEALKKRNHKKKQEEQTSPDTQN